MAEVLAALRPLLDDPAKTQGRPARQVRPARAAPPRHRRARLSPTTRCSKASCSMPAASGTTWIRWRERYLGYDTIRYEDVAGKGAKQIAFSQVALDEATATPPRTPTSPCACIGAVAEARGRAGAAARLPRDRDAAGAGAGAHGGQRRADRRGRVAPAERGPVAAHAGRAAAGAPNWPGARSTSIRPSSCGALLFDELKLPALVKTPSGAPSTNEEALEAIADLHELPRLILDYRGLAKLRSTYTDKLPEMVNPDTGRVHTSYHQAGAATGRLSFERSEPAEHPDPHRGRPAHPPGLRRAAGPQDRRLRLLADRAADHGAPVRTIPALLRAFASGLDVHRATAAEVFGVAARRRSAATSAARPRRSTSA